MNTPRFPGKSRPDFVYAILALILVAIATARLIPTYRTFTQTYDEPFHIACGMEWLDKGTYNYEAQHPPLARVAVGLGPYLKGLRSHSLIDATEEGNAILSSDGRYWQNLTLARLGTLPFLWLGCAVIWLWARRWFTRAAGVWALLLFLSLPPILAHAGLATLDMACAATVVAALYELMRWLEDPSWIRSLWLAAALSLALLSKFSSIPFLAVSCVTALLYFVLVRGKGISVQLRLRIGRGLVIACVTLVLLWAGYRFSLDPVTGKAEVQQSVDKLLGKAPFLAKAADKVLELPVPLKRFVLGIRHVYIHNQEGHNTYLLGESGMKGWWYFFPVVLAVKTPIGFLLLAIAGLLAALLRWRVLPWQMALTALFPIAIFLFCMTSRINLGVRHILSIYPLLALLAGHAICVAFEKRRLVTAALAVLLAGSVVMESWLAHPDYLAYFNQFAGRQPDRILLGSDLDWGQDLHRLSVRLGTLGVKQVAIGYYGTADLAQADLPEYRILSPLEKTMGYVAASVTLIREHQASRDYGWLKDYQPQEIVGKSIYLYHIPPAP